MNHINKLNPQMTKWAYSPLLLVILLGFLNSACLSPIDLDIPEGAEDAFVINAKIVKGAPSIFTLRLTRLFNFTTESKLRIIAKRVILSDQDGNEMEMKASADGFYYYEFQDADPIKIEIGGSYTVEVQTLDGRSYVSSPETLLPVPAIENITFEVIDKTFTLPDQSIRTESYIQYAVDTDLTLPQLSENSKLRWELSKVYKVIDTPIRGGVAPKLCYVDQKAGVFSILIYNGEATTINRLENHIIYDEKISASYGRGSYFTITQESLNDGAFKYWESIKNITDRQDNIYADPPGKVSSNFTETDGADEAFGYFYVTAQDTARIYIDSVAVGTPDLRCPSEDLVNMDGSCGDPLCCDCLSVENSQSEKPSFWVN